MSKEDIITGLKEGIKNIKAGFVSTGLGGILFIMGGVMVWQTYKSDTPVVWVSVETLTFVSGIILLLKNDEWITGKFKKK